MKNRIILNLILLVVSLISVTGFANVPVRTDTVPVIDTALLPAIISDGVVAITIEQMDSLTMMMLDCDALDTLSTIYGLALGETLIEVEKRDSIIHEFIALEEFKTMELKNHKWLIGEMDLHIDYLERDIKKRKFNAFLDHTVKLALAGLAGYLIIAR